MTAHGIALLLWGCLAAGVLVCGVVAADALAAWLLWRGHDDEPGRWES